jgi:hypothetical protein
MNQILVTLIILLLATWNVLRAAEESAQVPPGARMSYLENGKLKVGVDLNRGGAIVFLARTGDANLINNFDLGRQVQPSFFSGPVPFAAEGQSPAKHWEHIGWNPIQAGDDFKNPSRLLAHENDGRTLHVKCQPMQWALNNVPGDCTFDSWLELEGTVVKAHARLNNARNDHTWYSARLQELPAVYVNAAFFRVVSYTGSRPFTGEPAVEVPKPTGKHPWSFWQGTEGWSALLDANDQGLGLITPGRVFFTGGFAGKPGPNDTLATSTAYLAGLGQEILDHNIEYEFHYELVVGSLQEIRARALAVRSAGLPAWTFASNRQGWHYQNATDHGWPIREHLNIRLDQDDPQLISPYTFWLAEEAPFLIIEAAFKSLHRTATLFWQSHNQSAPGKDSTLTFPIEPDGDFHRYVIRLADSPAYRGPMIRLRLDPVPVGIPGDWVKVKSIRFVKTDQ